MNSWLFIGALLYGALYLQNVIAAGFLWGNRLAVLVGIAACGVAFLSYVANLVWDRSRAVGLLVFLSWALGVAAGLSLLFARS